MTRQDIIDAAVDIAVRNGVNPPPPGPMIEQELTTLWSEWSDFADPRVVRLDGVISSDLSQWYSVPGIRSPIYVAIADDVIGPTPESSIYYNEDNDYSTYGYTSYILRGEKIRFSAGTQDDATLEAGATFTVVYTSNNEDIPNNAEPYVPEKLHLYIAKELAFRMRESYGGNPINQSESYDRIRMRNKFTSEMSFGKSEKDTPVQPNWVQEI